jgi:hypothetical protein
MMVLSRSKNAAAGGADLSTGLATIRQHIGKELQSLASARDRLLTWYSLKFSGTRTGW